MLWGRSANICAFPNCNKTLVMDETEGDDASIIGEEAHIVAKKPDGPRGDSPLTEEERDKYDNLILLCSIHHKLIDDQVNEYPVSKLKEYKKEHEKSALKHSLTDLKKIKDDELYASYIEHFIKETELHSWNTWTSWIFGMSETIPKQRFEALQELPNYIVSRIWPRRYIPLESSFINFKNIVNDLMKVFHMYLHERPNS